MAKAVAALSVAALRGVTGSYTPVLGVVAAACALAALCLLALGRVGARQPL